METKGTQKRKGSFDASKKKPKTQKEQKESNKKREITVTEPTKRPEKKLKTAEEDLPRGGFFRPAPAQITEDSMDLIPTPNKTPAQANLFNFEQNAKKKKVSKKEAKQAEEMDEQLSSVIQILKITSMKPGLRTLAVVSGFEGGSISVDLPNHLKGFIDITEISDELNVRIEKELKSFGATTLNLRDYFRIGDVVRCSVTDMSSQVENKMRIHMSLRPSVFNQGLSLDNLVEGMLIRGSVKSIEDHGFIINVGINGAQGFVKRDNDFGENFKLGMPVDLCVTGVNKDAKVVSLSADPALLNKPLKNASATVECVLPGQLVKAEIFDTSSKGIFVRFLDDLIGSVYILDLDLPSPIDIPASYKVQQKVLAKILWVDTENLSFALTLKKHFVESTELSEVPDNIIARTIDVTVTQPLPRGMIVQLPEGQEGFVHCDRMDLGDAPNTGKAINQLFPIGRVVQGRVITWDNFNQMPILTVKTYEIEHPYFSLYDVNTGEIIEGEVSHISEEWIKVKLSEFVTGICYPLHWADTTLKNPEKKFKVGKKMKFKVIKADPRSHKLLLSAKPSIIDSNVTIPRDYDGVKNGDIISGWIVKISDFGLLVGFFEDLTAIALKKNNDLGIDQDLDHSKFYHLGQVITCKVVNVDYEKQRMRVSLNLDAPITSLQYSIGTITSAKILEISKPKKTLKIEFPNKETATIHFSHLSDFVSHGDKLPKAFPIGNTISQVLILDNSNNYRVTAKPLLIQAFKQGKVPHLLTEVASGIEYVGYTSYQQQYGTAVKFLGNFEGFDTKVYENIERGQTVKYLVNDVSQEKRRVKGTITGCQWDHKLLLEQYYKEEDMLTGVTSKIDWKQFTIGGNIDVTVKEVKEYGVTLVTPVTGVTAFALNATDVNVGDKLTGKILDIDYDKNVIDVTFDMSESTDGIVRLVKKNIVVVSYGKNIGFALSRDLNENVDPFKVFVVGMKVNVEVKGVYKGIHNRNLVKIVVAKNEESKNKKKKSMFKKSPKQ